MLGGLSPESTAIYYRLANELVRARLGGLHSARLILHSVDFGEFDLYQREGRWEEAGQILAQAAAGLEAAGAEIMLLCTNTMHRCVEAIEAAITVPLLHIADPAARAAKAAGATTVALLGTSFTMEHEFYRNRLASHGLEVLIPNAEDRVTVHRVIFEELTRGEVLDASRAAYQEVIGRLVARGAQGVVLGCTEIELLIGAADSPVPVFPTTRLHVEAAVAMALE
jgi:aspartate racemase